MVIRTTDFLLDYVLAAAHDYYAAELALTQAFAPTKNITNCQPQANLAIRRACEACVAIDGLTDRAHIETGQSMTAIRTAIDPLCIINGYHRAGAFVRVSAAANAYKHSDLTHPRHPISSFGHILAVGAGYGVDGFGIGKYSGVEVILTLTNGTQRKMLGDLPYAVRGWLSFLRANGAPLPTGPFKVCNVTVWP